MLKYETKSVNGAASTNYEVAEADVPVSVLWKLANRTFSHIMSNEASSACGNARESAEKDGKPFSDEDFLKAWRQAKVDAIKSGTLSMRQSGPRVDPLEKEMRSEAESRLRARAKSSKFELPKKMNDTFTTSNGDVLTLAELIARLMTREHDDIKKVAEANLARKARQAAQAAAEAEKKAAALVASGGVIDTAAALGI